MVKMVRKLPCNETALLSELVKQKNQWTHAEGEHGSATLSVDGVQSIAFKDCEEEDVFSAESMLNWEVNSERER